MLAEWGELLENLVCSSIPPFDVASLSEENLYFEGAFESLISLGVMYSEKGLHSVLLFHAIPD